MWIVSGCPFFIVQGQVYTTTWSNMLVMTSLAVSMTVNALVTGLIVFRIFKVFHKVKDVTGRKKLCSIIFIIIESGMALFAIQLACLVIAATEERMDAECDIYLLIGCIHKMLNVVISSVTATLYFTDKNVATRV
jgi:hypothetical protein